jgi:hypothetical protein
MRIALTKSGRDLIYSGRGSGTDSLTILASGPQKDVRMGPIPGPLRIKPLGGAPLGNIAVFFEWSVKTYLAECTNATVFPGGGVFAQFWYTVNCSIDMAGYSTITYTGGYEIPMSVQPGGYSILATADANWGSVLPTPMAGYSRTTQRTLSADRRRIDYTTVETQMPGQPLPRNIVKCQMHQRIHNEKPMVFVSFACTISGEVTCSAAIQGTKAAAWAEIYDIIAQRIIKTRNSLVSPFPPEWTPPAGFGGFCVVLITALDINDSIFSDEFSFSLSYRLLGSSLADIVAASGMWLSVGTDWPAWQTSMSRIQSAGGLATWKYDLTQDTILDLCNLNRADAQGDAQVTLVDDDQEDEDPIVEALVDANSAAALMSNPVLAAVTDEGTVEFTGPDGSGSPIQELLDPITSWIGWECDLEYVEDGNLVRHVPLAGTVQYDPPPVDSLGPAIIVAADESPLDVGITNSVPDVIQQVSHPTCHVRITGQAMRLGFTINAPNLVTYGGVALGPPSERVLVPKIVMNAAGVPVHSLAWRITYLLPTPPTSFPLPANPWLGMDGGTGE